MCATFQLAFEDDIEELKRIANQLNKKYGNINSGRKFSGKADYFPKGLAPVVGQNGNASLLHWGFPLKGSPQVVFNARSDSLEHKPLFSGCLENRCVVPATAFFEWGNTDGKKTKHMFSVVDLRLFYMAALWKKYQLRDEQTGEDKPEFCFTIITTEPNYDVRSIHNRMPAILTPQTADIWLQGSDLSILKPFEGKIEHN